VVIIWCISMTKKDICKPEFENGISSIRIRIASNHLGKLLHPILMGLLDEGSSECVQD